MCKPLITQFIGECTGTAAAAIGKRTSTMIVVMGETKRIGRRILLANAMMNVSRYTASGPTQIKGTEPMFSDM